jgi:hypothetical protein
MSNEGFVSIVVTYDNYDMDLTLNFRNDVLVNEFLPRWKQILLKTAGSFPLLIDVK